MAEWEQTWNHFNRNPKQTLLQFHKYAGVIYEKRCVENLDVPKLAEDLKALTSSCIVPTCPLLLIGSEDDPIIPIEVDLAP